MPVDNHILFCYICQIWCLDDATRVVLETDENNPGDFINANFINVKYICGCVFHTPKLLWLSYNYVLFSKIGDLKSATLFIKGQSFLPETERWVQHRLSRGHITLTTSTNSSIWWQFCCIQLLLLISVSKSLNNIISVCIVVRVFPLDMLIKCIKTPARC